MQRYVRPILIVLLAVVGAGVFTTLAIRDSQRRGRLADPPTFDDTEYFSDALHRLNVAKTEGLLTMVQQYFSEPPHSPFSSVVAVGCYAIFGRVDWAPYAGNSLIVFASMLFVAWMTRRLPLAVSLILMGSVLCVPVSAYAIHNFQPAIACGLATAIAGVGLATAEPNERTWKRAALFGITLGAAYLIKPTVFPLTTLIVGSAAAFLVLRSLINKDEREVRWRTFGYVAGVLVVGVAVFLPYLVASGPRLVDYIVTNIFGAQKHLWTVQGDWEDHWLYFAFGHGKPLIRDMIFPLLAGSVAGLIFLSRRATAGPWRGLAALLLTTMAAYSLLSMNEVKNMLWGGVFVYLMFFSAVYAGGAMFERLSSDSWGRVAAIATASITVFVGLDRFQFAGTKPINPNLQVIARETYHFTREVARDNVQVFFTSTGVINKSSFCYQLMRDGIRQPTCVDCYDSQNADDYEREIAKADIVVASEQWTGMEYPIFGSCRFLDQSFELIRSRPDFVEVGSTMNPVTHKRFVVFARKSYLASSDEATMRR